MKKIYLMFSLLLTSCCKTDEIPGLVASLNSPDPRVKTQSAFSLARCGSKAARAVPPLAALLYDVNPGVQSAAAYALRKIDTPDSRKIMAEIDARRRNRRQ